MAFDPILFPFKPNWRSPFRETLSFRSWAIPAEDGREQTGSSADQHRRRFDFQIALNRDEAATMENMLFAYQTRQVLVPHWGMGSKLGVNSSIGAVALALDTSYSGFTVGRQAVIYRSWREYEVVTITGVAAGVLGVQATTKAWPAGTKVYPLSVCFNALSASATRVTDWHLQMPVSFNVEPSLDDPNTPDVEPELTRLGYEVYLGRTNWGGGMQTSWESNANLIDFGSGMTRMHSASRFTNPRREHEWHFKTRQQLRDFRAWLRRREGLAIPVWMPTGVADFYPVADIIGGTNYINVVENGYGRLAAAHPARRDIIIQLRDGTNIISAISNVSAFAPNVDRVFVETPFASGISRANIKRISFLTLYRQSSQDVTIEWITELVARSTVNLTAKMPVIDAPPMSGGGGQIEE